MSIGRNAWILIREFIPDSGDWTVIDNHVFLKKGEAVKERIRRGLEMTAKIARITIPLEEE